MKHETSRRDFLRRGAAAAAGSALLMTAHHTSAQPGPATGARRNVIFILIDDQRYDAMGFMGHPFLETPHLDAMARNGVVFENAFVTNSLCSPSRATILTGTYAHRHGVLDNNTPLPQDLTTFPQLLQKNGYKTAFIGKWHMGGSSDAPQQSPAQRQRAVHQARGLHHGPPHGLRRAVSPRPAREAILPIPVPQGRSRGVRGGGEAQRVLRER
jgi:arylsulfatase A-like enzyme